jgi:glycolate oxidase iron-sulfur subunit
MAADVPAAASTHGRPAAATVAHPAFDDHHPPARELIDDCVHCGFCLPACPTYLLWGEEMDSPRGRILLMDVALRGEVGLSAPLVQHWDACLGCMACVTACPSGVRYGRLIEQTRQQVERRHRRPLQQRALRAALFAMLPYHRRMRTLAALLTAYRASGLQRLVRRSRLGAQLPRMVQHVDRLAPALTVRTLLARVPQRTLPSAAPPRLRVAMLTGCVQRAFFGDVNAATARVLAAYGCEVVAPSEQECCGALELHAGREERALRRARRLITVLEQASADRIAVNSAGCGSMLKEYGELLADDPEWAARATALSARVADVSEILAELGPPEKALQPLHLRLAYHDACHLAHAQGVRAEPRGVLTAVPGLELVDFAEPDVCCGSAGVYNLVEPGPAAELGRRKAQHIAGAAPDALAAGNAGCLLQIGGWLTDAGRPIPTFHTLELLDASLRGVSAQRLLDERRRLQASAGTHRAGPPERG